jgi:hypothetical protein
VTGRLRREAPSTTRALTPGEQRTVERLRRNADQLGDAFIAAQCERALAGDGEAAEMCLEWWLELEGQLD